jgi:hypothetical protein
MSQENNKNTYIRKFEDKDYIIFQSELEDIDKWRQYRKHEAGIQTQGTGLKTNDHLPFTIHHSSPKPSTSHNLVGLTFSGGGIRSATFNLGLLQALFRKKILHQVDYLSTVSGGGYIGACLDTLLNSDLKGQNAWTDENFPFERNEAGIEKVPVKHLRYFSNYITAEGGLIGKYFRPAMVFFRGIVLNFFLLLPYLVGLGLVLALLLDIPGVKNNSLYFDLPEFHRNLAEYKKAWVELRDYARKVTSSLPQNFTSEEERIEVTKILDSSEEAQKLQRELDLARSKLSHEWRTIWIIPGAFFALLLVIAVLFRLFYQKPFKTRLQFSTLLSWIFFLSVLSLIVEFYGIAIAYWKVVRPPASINFIALLALLAPRIVRMLDTPKQQKKKPWGKMALSIILLILVPIFFLYLIGVFIHYIHIRFLSLQGYLFLISATVLFFYLTKRFINVNEISLHNFYRDRLSRAYLMQHLASSSYPFERVAHNDQIKLSNLKPEKGPYH